jgi:cell division transport system permease protein
MTEAPIRTARLRLLPGRASQRRQGASPIVPPNSIASTALMAVVAIMSFLACLTVGAVTLVQGAAEDWQSDILREVTIQILPLEGIDVAAATEQALSIARAAPGVAGARALSDAENAALLEPWLGIGLDTGELPIPRLIVVEIGDTAVVDLPALSSALAGVPGTSLDDHRMWTERLRSMANVTVVVGFAVLILVFAATIMSVVFATRGAMAGNGAIVSVLHFIGAEDWFVAREFQRHFLVLGLKGGLVGAFGAAVLFALLSFTMGAIGESPEGVQVSALFGSFAVGPGGYFGALLVAFVIAVITAVTSRITVFRYLRDVR